MAFVSALLLSVACAVGDPLPEGNAFVRGLAPAQRQREEVLSLYTYDVTEVREQLDREGRARRRETRFYEVFNVKGRPVRRLVARDGRPLPPRELEKEERRARELAEDLRSGRAARELPGVRLSRILERYSFVAQGREELDGRCALVFDFAARPGDFDLERDGLLRRLAGRLWVDEDDGAVARVVVRNTSGLRFALGLGATRLLSRPAAPSSGDSRRGPGCPDRSRPPRRAGSSSSSASASARPRPTTTTDASMCRWRRESAPSAARRLCYA